MRRWPWFVIVFAIYPPLYIAAVNPGQVTASVVTIACCIAAVATVVLITLVRLFLSTWLAAGLGAGWLVLLFFSYGPANEWWLEILVSGVERGSAGIQWLSRWPHLIHTLVWVIIAWIGIAQLQRHASRLSARLTGGVNLAAAALITFVLVQFGLNTSGTDVPRSTSGPIMPAPQFPSNARAQPDIYVIVLDGYARADVLQQHYGFDNQPFLQGLADRGFQVSDSSHANYSWTFLSLGSLLNFDYIQPLLGDSLSQSSVDLSEAYELLRDNAAGRFLKTRGYRTVQLQSTWGGTGSNSAVDEFIPCHAGLFVNEYLRAIADASWLRVLASKASMDIASCHLTNFKSLAAQSKRAGPKFVLAHFLPPHHPYLFDREGNVLRRANFSDQFEYQKRLWEDRASYRDQLIFVNRRIGEVIDEILKDSQQPPVIVLLSDHGPNLQQELSRNEHRRIRLSNLTAVLLPGASAGTIPDNATPVNLLRRIFNMYFESELPILPDMYFSSTFARPFALREVDISDYSLKTLDFKFDKM